MRTAAGACMSPTRAALRMLIWIGVRVLIVSLAAGVV